MLKKILFTIIALASFNANAESFFNWHSLSSVDKMTDKKECRLTFLQVFDGKYEKNYINIIVDSSDKGSNTYLYLSETGLDNKKPAYIRFDDKKPIKSLMVSNGIAAFDIKDVEKEFSSSSTFTIRFSEWPTTSETTEVLQRKALGMHLVNTNYVDQLSSIKIRYYVSTTPSLT